MVVEGFRKYIPGLWKELIRIRQVEIEENQVIKDHAFDFISFSLWKKIKPVL